jgi:LysM repeat protein
MSVNQQLRETRVFTSRLVSAPRLLALMTLAAATLLVAACQSSEALDEAPPAPARVANDRPASQTSDDLTATEAAIAALNEAPQTEASQPTAQLIREGAPMNYTVKRGDTLWDIAAVFLRDPWFWPEIWQINPQVENPHLIYPGDVLSLAYGANGDARVMISQYSGARLQPRLRSDPLDGPIDTIPFSAIAAFLSKPSVISKDQALEAPYILAFRDEHIIGGTGSEIYVKDLDAPLNQRYAVMHVGEPIRDIDSRKIIGYQAAYVATAVVNAPGEDVAKAVLSDGAREALQGDRLIEQEGETSLTFTPHAPTTPVDGQIIAVADGADQIGQYQIVVLNRGANHSLAPGAVLAVDQQGALVSDRYGKSPWKRKAFPKNVQLPYERAGTLIVFKVFDEISYGLVIGARGPMRVADRIYNP